MLVPTLIYFLSFKSFEIDCKVFPLTKTEILLALATDNFFPFSNSDLKKKNDFFHIYFCGRLIAWKGINLVLKTFSEIKKNNKNCILSIIGSGTNINKRN